MNVSGWVVETIWKRLLRGKSFPVGIQFIVVLLAVWAKTFFETLAEVFFGGVGVVKTAFYVSR